MVESLIGLMPTERVAGAAALFSKSTALIVSVFGTAVVPSTAGAVIAPVQTLARTGSFARFVVPVTPSSVAVALFTPTSASTIVASMLTGSPSRIGFAPAAGVLIVIVGGVLSWLTVRTADCVPMYVAETVAVVVVATEVVVMGYVAENWPLGTVTLAGTGATPAFVDASVTMAPPDGAAEARVTVPVVGAPP